MFGIIRSATVFHPTPTSSLPASPTTPTILKPPLAQHRKQGLGLALSCTAVCLAATWPVPSAAQTALTNTSVTEAQITQLVTAPKPILFFCDTGISDDLGNLDGDWDQPPSPGRIASAAWDIGGGRYLYAYQLSNSCTMDENSDCFANWDVAVFDHMTGLRVPLRHKQIIPFDFDGDHVLDTSFRTTDHACSAEIAQYYDCTPFSGPFSVFTSGTETCGHSWSDYYVTYPGGPGYPDGVSNDEIVSPVANFVAAGNNAEFFVEYDPLCCAHGIYASTQVFGFVSDAPPDTVEGMFLGGTSASVRLVAPVPRVLLVHGICGSSTAWDPYFASALEDSGFAVKRLSYGSGDFSKPFTEYVNELAAKIKEIGADRVSVVGHSMGGLIAREYMRKQTLNNEKNRIAQLVMLGTPNHGSDLTAKILNWGPVVQGLLGAFGYFSDCLKNPLTKEALWTQIPGAALLNRLNYSNQTAIWDATWQKKGRGWKPHEVETALPANVYTVSVGGSGTFCTSFARDFLWNEGAYHDNDCTVATGSAILTNTNTTRAPDVNLSLPKPLAHQDRGTTPCGEPYYASSTFGRRVARILLTSPPNVPELPIPPATALAVSAAQAADDSLQMLPIIADDVPSGQITDKSAVVPATPRVRFVLLSTDAHLTLRDPNGTDITPSDAPPGSGITFGADPGFEGFEIVGPLAGTWTTRIDAVASSGTQQVAVLVEYSTPSELRFYLDETPLHPGDIMHVHGELSDGAALRTDVTWNCSVLRPDNVVSPLTLYDDGAHSDGLSGDGIYGNTVAPSGGMGLYAVTATASAPSVGPFATTGYAVLVDNQDLAVSADEIQLSENPPVAGDTLTVSATVHNNSSKAALGVEVELRDRRADTVLGTSTVDLAAGGAVTVQVPWVPAPPDSHEIEVKVSPYVLDESDYVNNTAVRTFVLAPPVGVAPGAVVSSSLRLEPPFPNPTSLGMVLRFSLPQRSEASLDVYDIIGRRVRSWRWGSLSAGNHSVEWDGRGTTGALLAPGVYVCRLQVGDQSRRQKVVLRR